MTSVWKYGVLLLAAAVLLILGFSMCGRAMGKKAQQLDQAAQILSTTGAGEADVGASDVKTAQLQRAQTVADAATIRALQVKASLDRAWIAKLSAGAVPGTGIAVPTGAQPAADAAETPREQAKDQLITDQDAQIQAQTQALADKDKLIVSLTDAVTHYKGAYDDAVKAEAAERLALQAQVAATRTAKVEYGTGGAVVGALLALLVH